MDCGCNTTLNYTSQCKLIKLSSQTKCSDFYFKTLNDPCKLYDTGLDSDMTEMDKIKETPSLLGGQEPNTAGKNKEKLSCQKKESLNHNFYDISEICSYKLSKQGYILPCSKGEHLQNCKMFECNMMFKCPDFYCVPWHCICDGKWDCPGGYDEIIYQQCNNRKCINMFKCKISSVCLHVGDVCNGHFDCPHEDDELLCLLKNATCPVICNQML